MNKVTLHRLPVMHLTVSYARRYEGTNKITHYDVGFAPAMTGVDPLQAIKELIEKTEGPTDLTLEAQPASSAPQTTATLGVELMDSLLANDKDIEKSLLKSKCPNIMYIQDVLVNDLKIPQKIANRFAKIANPAIDWANGVLIAAQHKMYGITGEDLFNLFSFDAESTDDQEVIGTYTDLAAKVAKVKKIPRLNTYEAKYIRRVHPCVYLSVAYEAGDEAIAEAALLADLRKYQEMDMILGHLIMPSKIKLADGIGSGKQPYVLFCFLFVDFFKIPGWNPYDAPKAPQHLPGIRTAAYEGALNWLPELDYTKRYEVETIKVVDTSEVNHKAYVDSYLESVPLVNKIAKTHKSSVRGSTKE